jgi:hypothetical protein
MQIAVTVSGTDKMWACSMNLKLLLRLKDFFSFFIDAEMPNKVWLLQRQNTWENRRKCRQGV